MSDDLKVTLRHAAIQSAAIGMLLFIGFAFGCIHKNREIEQIQTEHIRATQAENAKWIEFMAMAKEQ